MNSTLQRSFETIDSQAHKPRTISSVNVRQIIVSLHRRNNYFTARILILYKKCEKHEMQQTTRLRKVKFLASM